MYHTKNYNGKIIVNNTSSIFEVRNSLFVHKKCWKWSKRVGIGIFYCWILRLFGSWGNEKGDNIQSRPALSFNSFSIFLAIMPIPSEWSNELLTPFWPSHFELARILSNKALAKFPCCLQNLFAFLSTHFSFCGKFQTEWKTWISSWTKVSSWLFSCLVSPCITAQINITWKLRSLNSYVEWSPSGKRKHRQNLSTYSRATFSAHCVVNLGVFTCTSLPQWILTIFGKNTNVPKLKIRMKKPVSYPRLEWNILENMVIKWNWTFANIGLAHTYA